MSLQPTLITAYNSGLKKDKKPFLIIDEAFQTLRNAYTWRERVKRREGIKLVGRLRRNLVATVLTNQANGAAYNVADIFADAAINLRATEPNAEIEPTSVTITVGAIVFTDAAGDGILTDGGTNTGSINYATGALALAFVPALGAATNVSITLNYFPALPTMGLNNREIATINDEQTLYFDTKYLYIYDGNNFSSPTATTWSGSDAQFFWGENYRGSTPQERIHFTTNFTNPAAGDPIRHTSDAATWTDFAPAVGTNTVTNEPAAGNPYAGGTTPINYTLASLPVVPGSVKITVTDTVTNQVIGFRDVPGVYPAGTLVGAPSTHNGTINYTTGAIQLNFNPAPANNFNVLTSYLQESESIFQAKIIISYYGRLLFLNVWEGANAGAAVNIFNRCRFSQVGNPLERNAWITSIPGKGGFIDAPTNEEIISARFYKNTLIVFFESSTWQLRYVGEVGFPFVWERISSDLGSESTFSTILFDKGILGVGDKAIISSSGTGVERIDLDIPDAVFQISNILNGRERVHGVRDYYKEIAYWCFPEDSRRKFPNRTLLFNYRNASWSIFRDNVTALGEQRSPSGDSWDSPIEWDSLTGWNVEYPQGFPAIISGNQQGYIHWYHYFDPETTADAATDMAETESLAIKGITLSATNPIRLNIVDHNLVDGELIYLTGVRFLNTALTAVDATNLNDRFYSVTRVDDNNVDLAIYNFNTNTYGSTAFNLIAYTPDPTTNPVYMGGGQATLVQNMEIVTKDFNPYQGQGKQISHSYTDFQTDASPNSAVSVDIIVDSSLATTGNMLVGNTNSSTAVNLNGVVTDITQANPGVVTAPNHGMETGRIITFRGIPGMVEVNGNNYTITKISENSFSIGVDTNPFTPYIAGRVGEWLTQDDLYYTTGSRYSWHRFYATSYGQYLSFRLSYNDALMNQKKTHQSGFELNAMTLWTRPAGRIGNS